MMCVVIRDGICASLAKDISTIKVESENTLIDT